MSSTFEMGKNMKNALKDAEMGKQIDKLRKICHTEKKEEARIWLSVRNTWISCGHGRMSSR